MNSQRGPLRQGEQQGTPSPTDALTGASAVAKQLRRRRPGADLPSPLGGHQAHVEQERSLRTPVEELSVREPSSSIPPGLKAGHPAGRSARLPTSSSNRLFKKASCKAGLRSGVSSRPPCLPSPTAWIAARAPESFTRAGHDDRRRFHQGEGGPPMKPSVGGAGDIGKLLRRDEGDGN